jgi:hypothetical protein
VGVNLVPLDGRGVLPYRKGTVPLSHQSVKLMLFEGFARPVFGLGISLLVALLLDDGIH